ncbi:hypothetical protein HZS_2136, partial [Henneguya salminicola]
SYIKCTDNNFINFNNDLDPRYGIRINFQKIKNPKYSGKHFSGCCSEFKTNNVCRPCMISTYLTFGAQTTYFLIHKTSQRVKNETSVNINKEYIVKPGHVSFCLIFIFNSYEFRMEFSGCVSSQKR